MDSIINEITRYIAENYGSTFVPFSGFLDPDTNNGKNSMLAFLLLWVVTYVDYYSSMKDK